MYPSFPAASGAGMAGDVVDKAAAAAAVAVGRVDEAAAAAAAALTKTVTKTKALFSLTSLYDLQFGLYQFYFG